MKAITVILAIFGVCSCSILNIPNILNITVNSVGKNIPLVCDGTNIIGTVTCSSDEQFMSMLLYTKDNPYGMNISRNVQCNVSVPIAFVVHGFTGKANDTLIYNVIQELIKINYTVFSLDWSQAACTYNDVTLPTHYTEYYKAVNNTVPVGQFMAKYVISLMNQCNVSLNNILFIGHSLGAHVCGFAAKAINKNTTLVPPRIIAADPAGPCFECTACENRLCNQDAHTVIAIHTSVEFGTAQSIGTTDYYFNGGDAQPACSPLNVSTTYISCNHAMSMVYLADVCNSSFTSKLYPVNQYLNSTIPGNCSLTNRFANLPIFQITSNTCNFVMDYTIFDLSKTFDEFKGGQYCMHVNGSSICPSC